MVLPAQFQLGLELTNIINPISQAMSAVGSLALIDAIKKSGSDFITETKLASLIGRHRIDPVIKFHFREMVAKSDQSVISRYLDIILESGSGPTVQEALKNPALFSMVIQLSGLVFAHEDESLAAAIVEAIERIAQESNGDLGIVPDYVSLLGTLQACQQQTAAFRWALLYDTVEEKIHNTLASPASVSSRKEQTGYYAPHSRVSNECRALPFPVMQGLLMWLQSIQNFPEHRLLHVRCNSGTSTVVVWCHHILGLSLTMNMYGTEIRFGNAPYNLSIENSQRGEAGVSLMDPSDPQEPLFTLQNDQHSIGISYEHRAEAYGYGVKLLQVYGFYGEELQERALWVLSRSLEIYEPPGTSYNPTGSLRKPILEKPFNFSPHLPSRTRLLNAGRFLFAFDENFALSDPNSASNSEWSPDTIMLALSDILVAFASISEDDLARCTDMPLNLNVQIEQLARQSFEHLLSPSVSFHTLSMLLLGRHVYRDDYVKPAFLVSAWGWSMFFDSMDAIDPSDVSLNTLRVLRGVPFRRGFRRTRIIDGPQSAILPSTSLNTNRYDTRISLVKGNSAARKDVLLVGHHSDAFQVTQNFVLHHVPGMKYVFGLREMAQWSFRSGRLPSCQCNEHKPKNLSDVNLSIIDELLKDKDSLLRQSRIDPPEGIPSITMERVFSSKSGSRLFIYIADNPAARWIQLQCLYDDRKQVKDKANHVVLRGKNTCIQCAVRNGVLLPKGTLILL